MKPTSILKKKKSLSLKSNSVRKPLSTKRKKPTSKSGLLLSDKIKEEVSWNAFTVVAIGASAGGLEAITQFLQNLSPLTGMAFIYVQHLSPDHKSILPTLLSKTTKMVVQEIDDMEKIKPDNVYIIPYNKGIEVTDGHIKLLPRSMEFTLSIDVLFSSLAETHKENVVGIVLSGSGNDGTKGLKDIKGEGGLTFAQDQSAKFKSMPQSAIAAGVVDFILSPKDIAKKLNWISKHPAIKRKGSKANPEDEIANNNPDLTSIIHYLHKIKNVDFSFYKMNTIKRRIIRRMLIHKISSLKKYALYLMQNKEEPTLLHQDLLINVTEFFRDQDAFLLLKKSIFPQLLKSKQAGETLRIWVAACATGEEVYSIAMLLFEIQDTKNIAVPFQIFASDLSAEAINTARNGEYNLQQLKNVSSKRLQRFFTRAKDRYRISKTLRDVCIFAEHNILSDPPFSRMDFISCRNLLIYLDTAAQRKAIATFHYALNVNGCLMLGKSETIGASALLFSTPLNKKYKIYTRKKQSGKEFISAITPRILQKTQREVSSDMLTQPKKISGIGNGNLGASFDAFLLSHYAPASVIINQDLEILQFRGDTALYLQNASGKASLNILKMARIEITFELRNAIHHAIKTRQTVYKTGIEMNRDKSGSDIRIINLEVTPLKVEGDEDLLAIIFTAQLVQETTENYDNYLSGKLNGTETLIKDRRIKKLEEEIASARFDMASITQDQEAANEELQSANEEIVSSNEELQSLNEELETSKEEIESTNEELITTNQELQARIQQVEEMYTYYEAILSTIQEPMLVLDKDMRIKTTNKAFCKLFKVSEEECIGTSLFKLGSGQWNMLHLHDLLDDIVPKNKTFHDFEVTHEFPQIGSKILLMNAHRILHLSSNEELIVLTIVDITEVRRLAQEIQLKEKKVLEIKIEEEKNAMRKIEDSEKRYSLLLLQSPFVFALLKEKNMVISLANDRVKQIWGKNSSIEGRPLLEAIPELKKSKIPELIAKVYNTGVPQHEIEKITIGLKENADSVYFNFVYQPFKEADESISGVALIGYEVTDEVELRLAIERQRETEKSALKRIELTNIELIKAKKIAEQKTRQAEDAVKAKQQFLSNMSHEMRTPMNAIVGFTKVVLKTDLTEKQKEYLSAIKLSGDTLIALINDILDLAKVEAGKMTFEQTSFVMETAISSMLQVFEAKIQEKNLRLICEYDKNIPEYLVGDPLRLNQIILNLISNAVKFTTKGNITVSLQMLKEETNSVSIEFAISDTGIGIEKSKLTSIFEKFQQASNDTSRLYGGTGLGLAIVKQLVEPQGGSIQVESKIGKGSRFSFILSFLKSKPEDATTEENAIPTAGQNAVKVLVVEDNSLNRFLMKTILDDFGFESEMAINGLIAVEKLKTELFDIVLMDLQMPEMNGFEATEHIRNVMHLSIPIIALTADVTTVDLERCKVVGMDDYLAKPIDEKFLYSKIMRAISKADASDTSEQIKKETIVELSPQVTDLSYLRTRTKSNPALMAEMISLYLEQTSVLLKAMRDSYSAMDCQSLYSAVHKMIPSFMIVGISKEFEKLAIRIQDAATNEKMQTAEMQDNISQLEKVCGKACYELSIELEKLSKDKEH